MTAERWLEIERLFNHLIELKSPERRAFLSKIYDIDLRREVETLLTLEENSQKKLAEAVQSAAEDFIHNSDDSKIIPQQIGNYSILREIGRGGMGAVFLAERTGDDEIKKRVALKIIKRGMDTDEILRRFRNERRILAALEHPFVARLIDGGTTADGLPFFVMEYVEGLPLLDYCDRHALTVAARLALFRQICAAVSYAHQNLIVHRDLKPSNILITKDGTPRLLDFGIAKMLDPEFSDRTANQTATAFRLMTPEYASPEQVRGEQITTASDVYSLGVLLYELLTGQRPYQIKARCSPAEIIRAVCDTLPERPSAVVRSSQKNNSTGENKQQTTNNEQRTKSLKGDLDNIVLTALCKEPVRRYASVEQFSEDVRRHLEGLPISARPATFGYRAGKFVRRNRAVVALGSFVLALLVGFAATESFQSNRFRRERDRANIERERAEKVSAFLTNVFRSVNPAQTKGKELTAREFLDKGASQIQGELNNQPEVQAKLLITIADAYIVLGLYDRAEPLAARAFEINLKTLGEEHRQTLESKASLAGIHIWRGGKDEAVRLRTELDAVFRRLYGDDWRTAGNLRELARAYGVAGKKDEAEQTLLEAVEMARRISPVKPSQLIPFLTAEAEIYWNRFDFARAEPLLREALKAGQTIEMENPLEVAAAYGNLGRMLMNKGSLDEALPLLRRAWEMRRENIKEDNFMVGISMFNVGDCLFQQGNYDEAQQILRRVLEIYEKEGNGKVHLADALFLAARIAEAKNSLPEAEKLYRRAIEEAPHSWGAHTHKYNFPVQLALLMIKKGEAQQAEPLLRESLRGLQQIHKDEHLSISYAKGALGECLTVLNQIEEAEPLLRESLANIQSILGENHPRTKEALNRLNHLSHARGKTKML